MKVDKEQQNTYYYSVAFGGVIVIAIVALLIYRAYFTNHGLEAGKDINNVRTNVAQG